jgi:hypothetical protein
MSVIRGKFINPNQAIKQNADPFAPEDVARKFYVDNGLAAKQNSLGTGTTSQYLRGDLTWQTIPRASRVFTVGIDSNTIAGCIALCISPSATNNYIIEIPPGSYTENLTIPGNVHLKGLANPNDSLSVRITGQHTITGTSSNALNNRSSISNILFISSHATTALLSVSSALADTEVQITGCFFQNSATQTTARVFNVGTFGRLYVNNTRLRLPGGGQGGTHFVIAGGSLYTQYGLDIDGGTCVIDMTAAGYAQLTCALLACQGTQVIRMAANGLILMSQSAITNNAAIGSGVNMVGAGASFFATQSVFNILNNAASYVVTGVAGSFFGYFSNSYSNITGVVTRNIKINPTVTQLRYSNSLSALDISDFTTSARTAAVADSIVDGVTTIAPSQNAVFDALAAINRIPHKEAKVLTITDISNGYINLTRLTIVESTVVNLGGIEQHEGDDYTVSTVGGVTRITFIGTLLASLVPGDKIYTRYWSLT